jgi:hypothetical protein
MNTAKYLLKLKKKIRRRNYSFKTEKTYLQWVKRYFDFLDIQHIKK